MLAKLKISHMGLILVCFPLICELIFVGVLATLLKSAEEEIQKQRHSQEVISNLNQLDRGLMDACLAAGAYRLTNVPLFKLRYEFAEPMVWDSLTKLSELCKDNATQMHSIGYTKDLATAGLKLCRTLKAQTARPTSEPDMSELFGPEAGQFGQIRAFYNRVAYSTTQLLEEEKKAVAESAQKEAQMRAGVEDVLIGGVVFNILMALFIAYCFYRRIAIRLHNVMENTERLPAGQTLNPPIGGGDEIAELDSVFHGMASRLREMERMKGQMIAMISHDLRTPLTSIQGMLTLLGGGIFGALPEQAQKNVEMAEGDVSRLITLSDALIDVEGMANGRLVLSLKTVPFSNVIKRSVNSMGAFADQHGVEIEADETELLIFADEDRLVQVLVNLLSNAIKFSKAKMTVNIAVRPQRENAKLTVSDSGRGIPSDFIAKLFQPFQQAEEADAREKSGKGLGLAICKMIVEQHGGEIGVDSIYGRGSTFWFTVPLAEDPRATAIAQGSKTASTD